ncbi:MAG TPA: patatin-like phospholipase family protein [Plantibacter sp.]|uniref:patatin-like phospholipase family protein n=1 Tax=unclassified Plantibacter TaxID=2624265 RepID=UPI002C1887F8|nr:patatin-like phospholipase family protein [Plantibacter sp.]
MNTSPSPLSSGTPAVPHGRALVLGGGGSAGNAWLIGVVAGLLDGGLDVTDADLVIGTSAGATAAAQFAGSRPDRLLADILDATPPSVTAHPTGGPRSPGARPGGSAASPMVDHLQRTNDVIASSTGPDDMRRRLAASALALGTTPEASARWREIVAARFPNRDWPAEQRLLLTAVDARTAEPVEFDRHSGVELVDAVAASTSGGAPYLIGDALYIDGGYRRSSENADLAAGSDRVVVLSPLGGRTRAPLGWGMQLAVQVEELRAGGSRVESVLPDAASLEAFGDNMMRPSTRPPAARAGFAQGRALAEPLAVFWG